MFRAIIMLDCDICHRPFWRAARSVERDQNLLGAAWEDAALVVMSWSADAGWDVYKQLYICKDCIADNDDCQQLVCTHVHSP